MEPNKAKLGRGKEGQRSTRKKATGNKSGPQDQMEGGSNAKNIFTRRQQSRERQTEKRERRQQRVDSTRGEGNMRKSVTRPNHKHALRLSKEIVSIRCRSAVCEISHLL
jgi:hypothetical protein